MPDSEIIKVLDDYFSREKKFIDTSRIPLICQDIRQIHSELSEINKKLDSNFVTNDRFWPVRTIVYGGAGIILTAVVGAIVAMVVK